MDSAPEPILTYDWAEIAMHLFNEAWHGHLPAYQPEQEKPPEQIRRAA